MDKLMVSQDVNEWDIITFSKAQSAFQYKQ